jgi:hypothetical protein
LKDKKKGDTLFAPPPEVCNVDRDRQIRLLIPPFFLLAALLWGAYLNGQLSPYLHAAGQGNDAGALRTGISILGIIGVATLPVGYAIGVVTIAFLKCPGIRRMFPPHYNYEMPVSDDAMTRIWAHLRTSGRQDLNLCASSAFDHAYVRPEIHDWQVRRWTAFHISAQCSTALVLSVPFALAFHIQVFKWTDWKVWMWWASIVALIGMFVWNSVRVWRECYKMYELAAQVDSMLRPKLSKCFCNEEVPETDL